MTERRSPPPRDPTRRCPLRRRALRGLLEARDRVAVAVSGGSDSVALLRALHGLAVDAGWTVAGVVHVHHGLRESADRDEAFCRTLAASLDLSIDVVRVDVPAEAARARRSIETVAREARYAALEAARVRLDATLVATGHTLDDQAETVLMRLVRGAGTAGLGGIRPRRGVVVRPLLECRREALRAWLRSIGQDWVEDETNQDSSIARNRIRHVLVPAIEAFGPGAVDALGRVARVARADEDFLSGEATRFASSLVLRVEPGGAVMTDAAALAAAPLALARRAVRLLASQAGAAAADWSLGHVDAVLELARAAAPAGHLDLPGLVAQRAGAGLAFEPAAGEEGDGLMAAPFEFELAVPGLVLLGDGRAIEASLGGPGEAGALRGRGPRAVVAAGRLAMPFRVRNRRPGDRFRPLGAPGSRKVQDVLIDRKVPRSERDQVPIVTDGTGRIVWVAGVGIDEACRVTGAETGVVILDLKAQVR